MYQRGGNGGNGGGSRAVAGPAQTVRVTIDSIDPAGESGSSAKVTAGTEWFYAHRQMAQVVFNEYNPGDVVDITFTKSGKFKTITQIQQADGPAPAQSKVQQAPRNTGSARSYQPDPEKDKRIEDQVIFKGAIELYASGKGEAIEEAVELAKRAMKAVKSPAVAETPIAEE